MPGSLKVGVVGCSPHFSVRNCILGFIDAGAEVVALADPEPARLEGARNEVVRRIGASPRLYATGGELLADGGLDAVVLAVPNDQHARMAIEAMRRHRLHVYVQKPLALDVESARRVTDTAAAHGLVVEVGYQNRYGIEAALAAVDAGRIGSVLEVEARWSRPPGGLALVPPWLRTNRMIGGATLDLASHLVDTAKLFLTAKPVYAIAHQWRENGVRALGDEFVVEDRVRGQIGYEDGSLLTVKVDWEDYGAPEEIIQIDVRGDRGHIVVPLHGAQKSTDGLETRLLRGTESEVLGEAIPNYEMNVRSAAHFIAACRGDAEPQSHRDLLWTQLMLDGLRDSARYLNRRVVLRLPA
jgi:predicted dehydrogenase